MKEAISGKFGGCVTAPTHKAKKVIAQMTEREAMTIHSLLGLRPATDLAEFNEKNLLFSQQGDCKLHGFDWIVIDESSLLSHDAVALIKKLARQGRVKIIFMGDPNQLPPVKETFSSAFVDTEIIQFQLTKVERQSIGNPLIYIYDAILSNMDSLVDLYKRDGNITSEGIGYEFMSDTGRFTKLLGESFSKDKYMDNKIITWENKQARVWNKLVRRQIINFGELDKFVKGEYLTAHRTVQDVSNYKITLAENSAEYRIVDSYPDTRKQKDTVFKGHIVILEELETGMTNKLFFISPESYPEFYRIEQDYKKWPLSAKTPAERSQGWAIYYNFRNKYFLLGDILDKDEKVLVDKDFDYYYCTTTHKSQGSTYETAFVDDKNLSKFWGKGLTPKETASVRNRLKYVAFSRPSKIMYGYTDKPM